MNANSRQVGGTHYQIEGVLQHWDLVTQYGWDYFQGQIIKYVMRHKKKNGVQDLEKAAHFLEKYIEEQKRLLGTAQPSSGLQSSAPRAGDILGEGAVEWQPEGYYGDGTCLYSCRKCKMHVRLFKAPTAAHHCTAAAGV